MTHRVLVVDDDSAIREVAALSLEAVGGWQTLTAASGQDGIRLAAGEQPDAILLDVMMPGLDGPSTLRHLLADDVTREIPVILLTAKVQASDRHRFAQLPGVRGVLAKPFDPMRLADQVAALLGWDR